MYKIEDFYRNEGWGKSAINKRKERIILGPESFSLGGEKKEGFIIMQITSSFYGGRERMTTAHVMAYLTGT